DEPANEATEVSAPAPDRSRVQPRNESLESELAGELEQMDDDTTAQPEVEAEETVNDPDADDGNDPEMKRLLDELARA
ncbi:MAG: hypothetical protein HC802_04910, partial [Caldilineaceae bacterium]|nr:hypothetical protein [Caldilineaceae bacterium]